jgi:flagellar capping protein FliD
LFGNATVQQIQEALGNFVNQTYTGYGSITSMASIGITVGQDGTLTLNSDTLNSALASDPGDIQKIFTTNVAAVAGGSKSLSGSTTLSSLNPGTAFPAGHISIIDGNGTAHDIDLSTGVTTLADVIAKINAGTAGTVTAGINATGDGLMLTQIGGTQTPEVDEVNSGSTASALNIKGKFINGVLNGQFPITLPTSAVKGIGSTLSDMVARFNDSQTGILFEASQALETEQTQLTDRQTALSTLLASKKQLLLTQFANLESTIAGLQAQGTAVASIAGTTATTSSTKTST